MLEARNRLGGRIYTRHSPVAGAPVELGAEFVHGQHPELWRMATGAGALLYEIGGEQRYTRNGRLEANLDTSDKVEQIFSRMMRHASEDRTFAAFLSEEFPGAEWAEAKAAAIAYVEGFNAADHTRVSLQWLKSTEQASGPVAGERQFRPAAGYSRLVGWMADECVDDGAAIFGSTVVREIRWQPGRVSVYAENAGSAARFESEAAIITVPLAVLQASSIHFEPPIEEKIQAARQLSAGVGVRITLVCREAFWENYLPAWEEKLTSLSFLHALGEPFPTWWTSYPLQTRMITGWAGGAQAFMAPLPSADQISSALDSLAHATGLSRSAVEDLVEEVHHHDWQKDPFALGAYSYVPVGAHDAAAHLAAPCSGTLFFAGEATDTTGHTGTVHGAIASGIRAADQILKSMSPSS